MAIVIALLSLTLWASTSGASTAQARSRILYIAPSGLSSVDAAGGPGVVIVPFDVSVRGPYNPRWSPDGSWIAYMYDFEIWAVRSDGSDLRQLTWTKSNLPSWSADGRTVYFTGFGFATATRIGSVHLDGSAGPAFGNPTGANESMAQWSPDGTKVAFASSVGGGPARIFTMTSAGTGMRSVTSGEADESPQAWSPDGRSLLVQRLTNDEGLTAEVMDADGSNSRVVATEAVPLAWAPNGQRILVYHPSTGQLRTVSIDGSMITTLPGIAGAGGDWGPGSVDPPTTLGTAPAPSKPTTPPGIAIPAGPAASTTTPRMPTTNTTRAGRPSSSGPGQADPAPATVPTVSTPSSSAGPGGDTDRADGHVPVAAQDQSDVGLSAPLAGHEPRRRGRSLLVMASLLLIGVVGGLNALVRFRRLHP